MVEMRWTLDRTTCSKCKSKGLEIRTNGYPREIFDKQYGLELRYVCPNCGYEWLYDSLDESIYELRGNEEFHFGKDGKVIEK